MSPRVCATSAPAPRPATRVAPAAGASPWAWASHSSASFLAGRDEPDVGAGALGEHGGQRDGAVGVPGRPARDGDACRGEGPDEAVAIRRHGHRARRIGKELSRAGLVAEQALPEHDRVGPLAARQERTASAKGTPEIGR